MGQRAIRLDERMAFRPVVKPKDAEFHNIIPATKVVYFNSVYVKNLWKDKLIVSCVRSPE